MVKKISELANKYTYRLEWSEEDQCHLANCLEFPSLMAHGETHEQALREIRRVVLESVVWLMEEGEEIPTPIGAKKYNGKIMVRVSPELHKEIMIKSAEQKISLNKWINEKLTKAS